jgi:uncharacterized protein YbjT (DUF2867 family)
MSAERLTRSGLPCPSTPLQVLHLLGCPGALLHGGPSEPCGPLLAVHIKQAPKGGVRERPVRATVLGPVYFMENVLNLGFSRLGEGILANPLTPGKPLDQVSVLDIAGMAVHAVENPDEFVGERIDIASDRVTGQEAARMLSEVLGREIPYQQMPLNMVRQRAGEEVAAMFENFENNTDFLERAVRELMSL